MILANAYSPAAFAPIFGQPMPLLHSSPLMVYFQQLMQTMMGLMGPFAQGGLMGGQAGVPMMGGFGNGNSGAGLSNFLGGGSGNARVSSNGSGSNRVGRSGSATDNNFTTLNVNIKSRPAMPQKAVLHDVRKAAKTPT